MASGKIYTYASGTTTPLSTYQTSSGTAWGAYISLDSAGRPTTGDIYLLPGQSYKYIAQDSAGNTLWTQDGIGAVPPSAVNVDITGIAGENLTAGDLCYIGTGGSWFKADADAASSSTEPVLGFCVTSVSTGDSTTFRTDGQIELAGPLTAASRYYVSATAGAITTTPPANTRLVGQAQSTTLLAIALNPPPSLLSIDARIKTLCNGRLTLTSGTPVTTGDVTAATTLYWTPYLGNEIALYSGTGWMAYALAQLSIAVPSTMNTMYDVFVDYNSGTPALALVAWTNDTTRATALTTQDGIYVLTGATTKRYVGSFRTTGSSGQTEDSATKRYVWNYYNRVHRMLLRVTGDANWTYTTATVRQANANAANQVEVVVGVQEVLLSLSLNVGVSNTNAGVALVAGIGQDSTTTFMTQTGYATGSGPATTFLMIAPTVEVNPAVGRHFYSWNEYSEATGTTTWYGHNQFAATYSDSGLTGWIQG